MARRRSKRSNQNIKVDLRMPKKMHREIMKYAKHYKISFSKMVRAFLVEGMSG